MSQEFSWIQKGGITSARGYRAAGLAAGIKKSENKDLALVWSDFDTAIGATFTTNQIKAAPVKLSMQHVRHGKARGIILNAGNANACTGVQGINDAKETATLVAKLMKVRRQQILVCSTGRIGVTLPMEKVRRGIRKIVTKLDTAGGRAAAKAIMTSDTCSKECAVSFSIGGRTVTIGAMAKGAGMIHPNMATMLACVTTDAAIDKKTLQRVTHDAVDMTFNRISVDGDTSTNDTVLVLANGAAGNEPLTADHDDLPRFKTALFLVLKKMARMIIEDGEGISHVVDVRITGAANAMDAKRIAEGISRSPLVKTSWCGGDPNWGRLMDVLGYCGARVREELVDIYYDGLLAVKGGIVGPTPLSRLRRIVAKRHFTITIDLHLGKGDYNLLVNDLTEQYVVLNKGE